MPLTSFSDARPWAKAIATRVTDGTMPPWHADPAHGQFANDRSLSEKDRFDSFVTQLYFMFTNEPLKQVYPAAFAYKGLIPGVRYFVTWSTQEGGHSWRVVEALAPGPGSYVFLNGGRFEELSPRPPETSQGLG